MSSTNNNFRQLGKTKLFFFPLGLGTASFAGVNMVNAELYNKPTNTEINKLFNLALEDVNASENNMLMVDTSSQYGESELRIAQFIKDHPSILKKMYICTKWGLKFKSDNFSVQDYSLKNLNDSLENSIKLLQKIDLFYIHTNPSVSPLQLKTILDKKKSIIPRLKEIKKSRYGGIRHIGISISSEENLSFLVENKHLLDELDVLQINANIVINNPKLIRLVYSLGIGIVLNSVYRKIDKKFINTKEGLKNIFCKILDSNKDVIILTGTKNILHLKDNINFVRSGICYSPLKISYLCDDPLPVKVKTIAEDLENYFSRFNINNSKLEKNLISHKSKNVLESRENVIENIINIFIGSLKTRLGPAPDKIQRKILSDIITFYVDNNIAIDAIFTWGPKKFFAGKKEDQVDLSEALALERLMFLSDSIKSCYSPGVAFSIFVEDFEGKFIEGEHLADIFDSYISGLENLVKVLNMEKIVKVIRTNDLLKVNYNIQTITKRLEENYEKLKKYWHESDLKGIEGSELFDSYKQIEKLGWYGKIGNDTRDYYLGRLNNILGDTKNAEEKINMTIRLLACVLIHRQFNILRIHENREPVKLSFLKISGGPKKLMEGRIDMRTIPTNISKRHISPWASKGCLKVKEDQVLPSLKRWQELLDKSCKSIKGKMIFERSHRKICFDTNFLVK